MRAGWTQSLQEGFDFELQLTAVTSKTKGKSVDVDARMNRLHSRAVTSKTKWNSADADGADADAAVTRWWRAGARVIAIGKQSRCDRDRDLIFCGNRTVEKKDKKAEILPILHQFLYYG